MIWRKKAMSLLAINTSMDISMDMDMESIVSMKGMNMGMVIRIRRAR